MPRNKGYCVSVRVPQRLRSRKSETVLNKQNIWLNVLASSLLQANARAFSRNLLLLLHFISSIRCSQDKFLTFLYIICTYPCSFTCLFAVQLTNWCKRRNTQADKHTNKKKIKKKWFPKKLKKTVNNRQRYIRKDPLLYIFCFPSYLSCAIVNAVSKFRSEIDFSKQ